MPERSAFRRSAPSALQRYPAICCCSGKKSEARNPKRIPMTENQNSQTPINGLEHRHLWLSISFGFRVSNLATASPPYVYSGAKRSGFAARDCPGGMVVVPTGNGYTAGQTICVAFPVCPLD